MPQVVTVVSEDAIRGITGIDLALNRQATRSLPWNIGPGFVRLGPFGSYQFFPDTSKLPMTIFK